MPTPRRKRTLKPDRILELELLADSKGSEMRFWEFPFGFEIEAPDSATQELEELATLAAGANWGMEFADTAMHFRFRLKGDAREFLRRRKMRTIAASDTRGRYPERGR